MIGEPFVSRWCQLTKEAMRVYAGSEVFAPLSRHGMTEVPIASIAFVQRVKYDIKARTLDRQSICDNQFEIFLKDDLLQADETFHHEPHLTQMRQIDQHGLSPSN